MPWKPRQRGEVPTLGFEAIDWIAEYLAAPDRGEYEPFVLYREQEDFVLRFYELDPRTCRRRRRRGVYSRPRGSGKSPLLAALAIFEALGPAVPDGWDAQGQPVGKPWSDVRTPLVQVAAVSEEQTKNTWQPLLEMLDGPVLVEYPGLEPLDTFVNLPRGKIEKITSSARTVKGNKPVFAVLDQTEEWVRSNGGLRLAEVMRINAAKIGGSTIESPNAYTPGDGSVAEESAKFWADILAGRARDDGLYFDHREAPADTDLEDRKSLLTGLRVSYGDSSGHKDGCVIHTPACPPGHVDLDTIIATIWDPSTDPQTSRADFLNQITHAADALVSQPEWKACLDGGKVVADRDIITLGFDGSRGRAKGKPDATALIACRVSDLHVFELGIWEAPNEKNTWATWSPSIVEIEAAIRSAFRRYRIAAFYCDPAKDWRSHVNAWEATYGDKLVKTTDGKRVHVTRDHPFEWWMTGGRAGLVERLILQFYGAIANRDLTHDGSHSLTRHVLNTRRRLSHGKVTVAKEHPYSANKIDGCVGAILAVGAAFDAVAAGVGKTEDTFVPYRIR